MSEIATHWHKLLDAVASGRVKVAIMNARVDALADLRAPDFNERAFASLVEQMSNVPRFVIDAPVTKLVLTDQALMSIGDMMVCGVLKLPYEYCVIEYTVERVIYSVLLRECEDASGVTRWYGSAISLQADEEGHTVMCFPCKICLEFKAPEDTFDTENRPPLQPTLDYSVEAEPFVNDRPDLYEVLNDAHFVVFQRCVLAFVSAVLLPQTIGLEQRKMQIKDKFNRNRTSKGRSPIPSHTLIKLGSFDLNDSGNSEIEGVGRVEVHLRRAHKRRVVVGEGRRGREWRFFPAQIVGYLPDGRKPTVPEMLATRAAKPYLIKL